MGQQRVNNIALVNVERMEREYVTFIVNNDTGRTIVIFRRRFMNSYDRSIRKNIVTTYVGLC